MMAAILSALQLLNPAGTIELRALVAGRMQVERFEQLEAATEWATRQDARPDTKAVYAVMNPFDPALVTGAGVTDSAITARRWLLVDVDPTRPPDTNATRDEMALSATTARGIEDYLHTRGWPDPVRALSGSGAHLLYRVELPNDAAAKALVDAVLRHLASKFSAAAVTVDTSVSNSARITKLYGTRSRKGPHSEERPQRVSRIARVPDPLVVVPRERMEAIAAQAPKPTTRPLRFEDRLPGESAYDLRDVLARVVVLNTKQRDGATWYLIACPWAFEHTGTDGEADAGIVVQPDGAMGFKCLHAHCADRNWRSLRDHLAIDTRQWKERRERTLPRAAELPREREPGEDDEPDHGDRAPARRVTLGAQASRAALISRMDIYAATGAMPGAISSGMRRLDGMLLGGFRPGKFYVLGGETGRGKTTLLMQWAIHAAIRLPCVVGVVSPEMDEESLTERLLAARTGYGLHDYRKYTDRARMEWETCALPQNILASFDANDIAAFAEEERPGLLIVDYAQQAVAYDSEHRHAALAMLGALCLDIAKRHNIPILLGTQVNVTAEREFSIRETRILEHQADAVIYIDITYEKQTDGDGRRQVKSQSLFIQKNRHGYSGRIPINWDAALFRFTEV